MQPSEKKTPEHGAGQACYVNGPDGYQPTLYCACGESFRAEKWEYAGADLDAHLEENGI